MAHIIENFVVAYINSIITGFFFHMGWATTEEESESFKSQTCKRKVKGFPESHSCVYSQPEGTGNGQNSEHGKNGNRECGTAVNLCCMITETKRCPSFMLGYTLETMFSNRMCEIGAANLSNKSLYKQNTSIV